MTQGGGSVLVTGERSLLGVFPPPWEGNRKARPGEMNTPSTRLKAEDPNFQKNSI